jgi:two-component system sensor histidine kinase UhpB
MSLHYDLNIDLGPSATLTIYRTVQEALINAIRHANASAIDVNVDTEGDRVRVRIADNGRGLPSDWARPGRYGLRGLRERLATLGGRFDVRNGAQGGVELLASIPLTAAAATLEVFKENRA